MRSRAARSTCGAVALIATCGAAFFHFHSEREIARLRTAVRSFDLHAREAAVTLADARAAQQAYVAAGQGVAFWMPKVASLLDTAARTIDELRASAASVAGRELLMQASATVTEFGNVDRRARDYLSVGQQLMAGDVVFTEGGETAAQAARQVERARLAEHQAFQASEGLRRKRQGYVAAAATGLNVLLIVLLAFASPTRNQQDHDVRQIDAADRALTTSADPPLHDHMRPALAGAADAASRDSMPTLRAAAELCTDFGRVNDLDDLKKLLARAADALDASGLIVWLGGVGGATLKPVLAHGYAPQVLARMPAIARAADNAAAAAYRTSTPRIVLARPGESAGAVVAPLLTPDGCIGALTAEIKDRGETSDAVQALAAIFAAHLAGILAPSASTSSAEADEGRIASA